MRVSLPGWVGGGGGVAGGDVASAYAGSRSMAIGKPVDRDHRWRERDWRDTYLSCHRPAGLIDRPRQAGWLVAVMLSWVCCRLALPAVAAIGWALVVGP